MKKEASQGEYLTLYIILTTGLFIISLLASGYCYLMTAFAYGYTDQDVSDLQPVIECALPITISLGLFILLIVLKLRKRKLNKQ